jgi:tetrahydromethanopterin S-methyltransferase subunit B
MVVLHTLFRNRCRAVNGTIASTFRTNMLPQKPNTFSTSGFISDIFFGLQIHLLEYVMMILLV